MLFNVLSGSDKIQQKSALDSPLQDNTVYTLSGSGRLTLAYPSGNFQALIDVTFGGSAAGVTFPGGTTYIGETPDWATNTRYHISILNGVAVIGEVGDGA